MASPAAMTTIGCPQHVPWGAGDARPSDRRAPCVESRRELAEQLGMAEAGGTFGTYLSTLRRNGLAGVDGGGVVASDSLFLRVQ
jgi:hypothetical protein